MRNFYHERIGFPIISEAPAAITFSAGATTITFVTADPGHGRPFYHFAFNIPQNKVRKARTWQLERTPLVITPQRQRDPAFPDDVRHFRNWNAHSLFFLDPAGNVLEYIARHDLTNDAPGDFTAADILHVSEIGFIVDDQQKSAKLLHDALGLNAYPLGTDFEWAMGDEDGLLLCLRTGGQWATHTDKPQAWAVFPTQATIRGNAPSFTFDNYPYKIG